MLVFTLMNLYVRRKVAQVTIAKDEQEIQENKAKAEEIKKKDKKVVIKTKVIGKDSEGSTYHMEVKPVESKNEAEQKEPAIQSLDKQDLF